MWKTFGSVFLQELVVHLCTVAGSGAGEGMQAHLQKFWFVENLGKIPETPGKNGA